MLVKQKSLSHFCEKGFCIYSYCFRYMRQASSHRQSGMIMEIIMKPCSRINLCFFLRFVLAKVMQTRAESSLLGYAECSLPSRFSVAKLYTPIKLTKQTAFFLT